LLKKATADGKGLIVFGNTAEFERKNSKTILDREIEKFEHGQGSLRSFVDKPKLFVKYVNGEYYNRKSVPVELNAKVKQIALAEGVTYFDKLKILCDESNKTCLGITDDGFKAIYDEDHFSLNGAKALGRKMSEQDFAELLIEIIE